MLDAAGELANGLDDRTERAHEDADEFGFGVGLGLAGEAPRCGAQPCEQLLGAAAPGIAVLGQEGLHALAEPLRALRRREAGEEGKRDRSIDVGEDGGRARPEALEQAAELVGQADAGGDEVVAAAHECAQRLDHVADGRERAEAVAVRAQDVGEHVGIAGIGLRPGGSIARPAGLHDIRMDRHDHMAGGDQCLHDEAGGALDGDGQRLGRRDPLEPRAKIGEAGGIVPDIQARLDGASFIDNANGVAARAPVKAGEEGHVRDLRVWTMLARAGRSCGSLIDRRSGWQAHARHPVVRPVLPAPAARRVSRGPSTGERRWPSRQTLGWRKPTPLSADSLRQAEVHQ